MTRVFGLVLLLAACSSENTTQVASGPRLVSLAPHITELVYTAGAQHTLVGVVEYSDFPDAAKTLPRVGDAFQLDLEGIVAMRPDYVLAWQSGNPSHSIAKLKELGLQVVSFEPNSFESIASELRRIGEITGSQAQANQAATTFLQQLSNLRATYQGRTPVRVFYQISAQPIYTVNGEHVISDAIRLCGGTNIFADLSILAPVVDLEAVLVRDPEVIVFGQSFAEDARAQWTRLQNLSATRLDGLHEIKGDHLSRASTRMVQGVARLCELIDQTRVTRRAASIE